jgi:hypothetical protein
MWFDRTARNGPPIEDQVVISSLMLAAVSVSGALTCVGWGCYWRSRGYAFPNDPGDWLLTMIAATAIGLGLLLAGVFVVFSTEEDWLGTYNFLAVGAMVAGWIWLCLFGQARHGDTSAWRLAFGATMILPLATVMSPAIPIAAWMGCLIWGAWRDRIQRQHRSWTHWFGVIAALSLGVASIGVLGS